MKVKTEIAVRGYHLDMYGHVNNARYLEFLEEGRWQWFERVGSFENVVKEGLGFTVVNINIDYRRPAFQGEVIEIYTELISTGNRSAVIHQLVLLKGSEKVVADAKVTFVMVSLKTGRPVELTQKLLDDLGLKVE
ncbi:MAG: thioesterase [Deltaproteobacteria bacterium]|nr:MAG: thioesterase [Deltaproteobacteria bacterium]